MKEIFLPPRPNITSVLVSIKIESIILIIVFIILILSIIYTIHKIITTKKRIKDSKIRYDILKKELFEHYKSTLTYLDGKDFIYKLTHFLESYVIIGTYSSISDIYKIIGLKKNDILTIEKIVYENKIVSKDFIYAIKNKLENIKLQ